MRCGWLLSLLLVRSPLLGAAEPTIDFARDVRPIFTQHCLACHGPAKQRGGLRLDDKTAALRGGDSGPAFVPKDAANSLLVQLVSGTDADRLMPPQGAKLTPAQIATVRAWINQGADWPGTAAAVAEAEWWSLRPLTKPTVPTVPPGWTRTPVDAFIWATLHAKGLTPAPEADRRTLVRRLSFDLLGLPPTPEQIAAFVADPAPDAYERLVDRLLADPAYGERGARHWLDVVHYGDTHGYDKDQPRPNAWPYRDYVIRALNADKPYGQFVREQIAGDVLYPGTLDGTTALGFLAAGPWDLIGHVEVPESKVDGQIARHLDRDDLVATTMNTFVSLTVQCAQCHHHKFDPIRQEDYYRVQAVFAALDRAERPYHADARTGQEYAQLSAFRRSVAPWVAPTVPTQRPEFGYHSGIAARADTVKWVQIDLGRPVAIERVVLWGCFDNFNQIGAGFGFPVRFKIEALADPVQMTGVTVLANHTHTAVPNPGTAPQTFAGQGIVSRYVRITATQLTPRQNDFVFALAEVQVFDAAGTNHAAGQRVTALDRIDAPPRWRLSNLTDGAMPGSTRAAPLTPLFQALLHRIDAALAARVPTGQVYAGTVHSGTGNFVGTGRTGGTPRPIHVLRRGDVKSPGAVVGPGTLTTVPGLASQFPADAPEGTRRAALAQWLTDTRNPLPWRSIVNRVWHYHFGKGIVPTPNDFGRMGQLPTHPELLDWLAADFRDGPQSLKRLHRLLVTSAVYRQTSVASPAALAQDANNAYLARMPRRKLEAEAVRDAALAVAGLLDRQPFGPPFRDFVVERPEHSPHYEYHRFDPADRSAFRRAIYRMVVRSKPQPFLTALDCADPSMLVEQRNESLSPVQALALYNNGLMLVAARQLAARVQSAGAVTAQVRAAFHLALGREPNEAETHTLTEYVRQHGLANGCRVILNLNEFLLID